MKTYKFKIDGKDYTVTINGIEGRNADLSVNGVSYNVELENEAPAAAPVQRAAEAAPVLPLLLQPRLPPPPARVSPCALPFPA